MSALTNQKKILFSVAAVLIAAGAGTFAYLRLSPDQPTTEFTTAPAPETGGNTVEKLSDVSAADDPVESDLDENECSIRPPGPFLNETAYRGYQVNKTSTSVEETVSLEKNISLKVTTTGCEDFASAEFLMKVPDSVIGQRTPLQRLQWLKDQLGKLSLKAGEPYRKEVDMLLQNFDKITPSPNQLWSICNDGTLPGPTPCELSTGGATEFEMKEEDDKTVLIYRHYTSA